MAVALPIALAGAARGQEAVPPQTGGETIGRVLDALQLRAPPQQPPDFVARTRPAGGQQDYAPLAPSEPARAVRRRTPAEMEAIGARLDSAAAQNRARAARVKIPDTGAPAPAKRPRGN